VTAVAEAPATATGPTARTVVRSWRGPVLVALALVVTALLVVALTASAPRGRLDPGAYTPDGSHAIAQLLTDGGVPVRRVTRVEQVRPSADTTILVAIPQALTPAELERLAGGPGELVLVGADQDQLRAIGAAAEEATPVDVEGRRPACDLPAAVRAGEVDIGGATYRPTGAADTVACYASGGRATLLRLPAQHLTLLGSGVLLTNDRLDRRGNASLALGLLGTGRDVQWVLPRPGGRDVEGDDSLTDLVPDGLKLAVVELLIAAAVLALWRARRLGPVVSEPLPVIVRASEAVEGRSRLYRAARARGTAADALRAGTRDRVVRRLGLSTDAGRAATVDAVAARTGRDPTEVDALLYGAAPGDDTALVRLAGDLSALEQSLTREVAGP
jgi:hypothetical protein